MVDKEYDSLLESFASNSKYDNEVSKSKCNEKFNNDKIISNVVKEETKFKKQLFNNIFKTITSLLVVAFFIFGMYFGYIDKHLEKVGCITNYNSQVNIESDTTQYGYSQEKDWSIENNIDTLYNIQPEIWETLTEEQKTNTIDNLKNIELYYLGVSTPTKLIVRDIGNNIAGQHYPSSNIIEIDKNHLINDSVYDVVNTICHECRHAFQYACVNAYQNTYDEYKNLVIFNDAKQFKDNYANYYEFSGFNETYDEYASQTIEADASEYAEQATNDYYSNLIPKYIESE